MGNSRKAFKEDYRKCNCGKPLLSGYRHCQECLNREEEDAVIERGGLLMLPFREEDS